MKILFIVVRLLLGLLFLMSSITYFFDLQPQPEISGDLKVFNDGLEASGYIIPLVKCIELITGILLVAGRFVPLAILIISPIAVNILMVNIMFSAEGLPLALFIIASILLLIFRHRDRYLSLIRDH